jgi:hypothetical protein
MHLRQRREKPGEHSTQAPENPFVDSASIIKLEPTAEVSYMFHSPVNARLLTLLSISVEFMISAAHSASPATQSSFSTILLDLRMEMKDN